MTQEDELEKLQIELYENPRSGQFVRLAELYLSKNMTTEALALVQQSLKFYPDSVSGLILLGRTHKKLSQLHEAIPPFEQATRLAIDNWRAWFELGETYLSLKVVKKALAAFKKVLFLNPTHPFARRAVAKLEVLSADEYEDELFEMTQLPDIDHKTKKQPTQNENTTIWSEPTEALVRILSYIDALIIRHENKKAIELLNDCSNKFGSHPEIESRRLKLSVYEQAEPIQPKSLAEASKMRQHMILEKKTKVLEELLRRIESKKSEYLST